MPDKFSKIYQNKIIGVGFFVKSQITEVVKDAIRFQVLSKMRDLQVLVSIQVIKKLISNFYWQ